MLMRSMPGVLAHARQRDHHVLVDLEGVGVAAMAAVRLRSSQNFLRASALTATKPSPLRAVGDAHHLAGGARHGGLVVADDVAHQHHLGQAAALALGGVAHRLQVAVVQVLQAGQHGAARRLARRT
jgi:hypothetical protein